MATHKQPAVLCGATTRQRENCKLTAGWGTNHLGHGPCRFHDGDSQLAETVAAQAPASNIQDSEPQEPIESPATRTQPSNLQSVGSARTSPSHPSSPDNQHTPFQARIDKHRKNPRPLDLLDDLAILRAFVDDLIERWEVIYGPQGALMTWYESFPEDSKRRPKLTTRQLPDFTAVTALADRVGAMVDRIQKHNERRAITQEALDRFVDQMGVEVAAAIQEAGIDGETSSKLYESVERRWHSIKLEPGQPGNKRASKSKSTEGQEAT
ncbi:MAG: hypothetical protein ACREDR_20400 [Blastocatellia bacterium]